MKELTYTEAVLEAFREEMQRDEKVFHLCGGLGPLAGLIVTVTGISVTAPKTSETATRNASVRSPTVASTAEAVWRAAAVGV